MELWSPKENEKLVRHITSYGHMDARIMSLNLQFLSDFIGLPCRIVKACKMILEKMPHRVLFGFNQTCILLLSAYVNM
ncbi:hypothetical protein ACS0TY_021603 [Phlomoides rotata]